jgi:hypothetical protein
MKSSVAIRNKVSGTLLNPELGTSMQSQVVGELPGAIILFKRANLKVAIHPYETRTDLLEGQRGKVMCLVSLSLVEAGRRKQLVQMPKGLYSFSPCMVTRPGKTYTGRENHVISKLFAGLT